MKETLHGYLIHTLPIGENHHRLTLLTEERSKVTCLLRGQPPEFARLFEIKLTFKGHQASASDFRYLNPVLVIEEQAKFFLLYINELVFKLAAVDDRDSDLFMAYSKAVVQLNYPEALQNTLRQFEFAILNSLGQSIDFKRDANMNSIEALKRYKFAAGKGYVESSEGRYSGLQIEAAARLDANVAGAMTTVRECLQMQIEMVLNGSVLKSRGWPLSSKKKGNA